MIPIPIQIKVDRDAPYPKLVPMKVISNSTTLPLEQEEKVIQGIEVEEYEGEYVVHPSADGAVILDTDNKYLRNDVVVEQISLQEKSVVPSKEIQTVTPEEGYDGFSQVSVEAIPSSYIIPTGTFEIPSNGTFDISEYQFVDVEVEPYLQDKTAIPTEERQIILPDGSEQLAFIDQAVSNAPGKRFTSIQIDLSKLTPGQKYHVTSGTCTIQSTIGTDQIKFDTQWIANPGPIPFIITSNGGVSKNVRSVYMSATNNWETANIIINFHAETNSNKVTQVGLRFSTIPYDGLSSVTVEPIDSYYIGSAVPRVNEKQQIPSTQAQMAVPSGYYTTGDVTVTEIPYSETSNPSGGYTVYIGG